MNVKMSTKKIYDAVSNRIEMLENVRDYQMDDWTGQMEIDLATWYTIWENLRELLDFDEPLMLDMLDTPDDIKDIPEFLRVRREAKNMTRYALAKAVGCSETRIKEFETGLRSMTVKWWFKLLDALE